MVLDEAPVAACLTRRDECIDTEGIYQLKNVSLIVMLVQFDMQDVLYRI